jgi:DNA-binding MarR family transcriptional regulator
MSPQIKESNAKRLADLTFRLLGNCHEKEERLAKKYGLTQAEYRCVRHIYENENINNKDISEKMNLSASRLTRIVDGLVNKGYVIREIERKDRRNMRLFFSDKGIDLMRKINLAYLKVHEEILSNINPEIHDNLLIAITDLLTALEKWLSSEEI